MPRSCGIRREPEVAQQKRRVEGKLPLTELTWMKEWRYRSQIKAEFSLRHTTEGKHVRAMAGCLSRLRKGIKFLWCSMPRPSPSFLRESGRENVSALSLRLRLCDDRQPGKIPNVGPRKRLIRSNNGRDLRLRSRSRYDLGNRGYIMSKPSDLVQG